MINASKKSTQKANKKLGPSSFLQNSFQHSSYNSQIISQNSLQSIPSASSKFCSRWSVPRCVCIQLLVVLGMLVLAAIIIPIVVLVLDNRSSSSPCAVTYSQSFTAFTTQAAQCTAWQQFAASLTCTSYSKMRIYGSNDPVGITVTDPNTVTALAIALRYNTTMALTYNGIPWRVWPCSSGYEITSSGSTCSCTTGYYTIRPCPWVSGYWGGIASASCNAASQTMSLSFE
ncbi:unnamed protein product [Adineta ricciae]|uniref:Uncharacterized protein n=1 Tax=Adineta ricciae TaxID=249248 RepID=A0A815NAK4_ADIRI|nr:unnamed protein product [Adineta ricciae]CAF1498728.1 unnamed protein product [Adineta ricciae]